MPTCVCAVSCCSNNTRKLRLWKKLTCKKHQCNYGTGRCICPPPFTLFPFPTEMKDPETRKVWTQIVCQNIPSRINWTPTRYDRVCSKHFPDEMPTAANPYPVLHLRDPDSKSMRRGRSRQPGMIEAMELPEKMRKLDESDLGRESLDEDELLDDSEGDGSEDNSRDSQDESLKDENSPKTEENTSMDKEEGKEKEEKTDEDAKTEIQSETSRALPTETPSTSTADVEPEEIQEGPLDLKSTNNPSTSTSDQTSDPKTTSEETKSEDQKPDQKDPASSQESSGSHSPKESNDAPIDLRSTSPRVDKPANAEKTTASSPAVVAKEKPVVSRSTDSPQPINLKSGSEVQTSASTVDKGKKLQPIAHQTVLSRSTHLTHHASSSAPSSRSSTPIQAGGFLPRTPSFTTPSLLVAMQDHGQASQPSQSKYNELLSVIEDMGRDVRPTYSGSKTSMERLKRGITYARVLLQQCKVEVKRSARY